MMPTYDELLKENALLRLEIAEAMRILQGGSVVTGEGREIYSSLVERASNIVEILAAEMSHMRDLEKELDTQPQMDGRQLDLFDSETGLSSCSHFNLCTQNCYPTHAAVCGGCPLKRKYG